MATLALVTRNYDQLSSFVESLDHQIHQFAIDIRVIDQMNEHAVAMLVRLQVAHGRLQRRQLSQLVIGIDQDFDGQMFDFPCHVLRVMTENDDDLSYLCFFQRGDDSFQKGLALDRQQRFWPTHAARFTRR